jgi:hypothetical protein
MANPVFRANPDGTGLEAQTIKMGHLGPKGNLHAKFQENRSSNFRVTTNPGITGIVQPGPVKYILSKITLEIDSPYKLHIKICTGKKL